MEKPRSLFTYKARFSFEYDVGVIMFSVVGAWFCFFGSLIFLSPKNDTTACFVGAVVVPIGVAAIFYSIRVRRQSMELYAQGKLLFLRVGRARPVPVRVGGCTVENFMFNKVTYGRCRAEVSGRRRPIRVYFGKDFSDAALLSDKINRR